MILELEEVMNILGGSSVTEKQAEELVVKLEVISRHIIDNLLEEMNLDD
jgi:hypothetical protein